VWWQFMLVSNYKTEQSCTGIKGFKNSANIILGKNNEGILLIANLLSSQLPGEPFVKYF